MVDLNDVALFVQIVKAGSFAEAGRRLGMPPNTASRRIQELERTLGLRLMQRSTRKLTLTDAGNTFFAQCAEQVEALAQSAVELAGGSDIPSGKVRVAAPADFFSWFPVTLLDEFLKLYPKVRLEFELSDARADLLGESIDVAFRAGRNIEPNLVARQLGWSRARLVCSPAYAAAHGMPTTLDELAQHDCVTRTSRHVPHITWELDGPDGETSVAVTGRFQANTSQAQIAAALGGLGIALLPAMLTNAHVKAGTLLVVMPEYGLEKVGTYFVYLSRRQLPRSVSAFIEFAMRTMLAQGIVQPLADERTRIAYAV